MSKKNKPRGRPFTGKDDPRRGVGGQKKKSVAWKEAEDELRAIVPRLLMMSNAELRALMATPPTVAENLAITYIVEHPIEVINRFLGKTPDITKAEHTGANGASLLPAPTFPHLGLMIWGKEDVLAFLALARKSLAAPTPLPTSAPAASPTPGERKG